MGVEDVVGALGAVAVPVFRFVVDDALDVVGGVFLDGGELVLVAAGVEGRVDVHVGGEVADELLAEARQDVDHAAGDVGAVDDFGEGDRGHREQVGGQDDAGVAAGDDGGDDGDEAEQAAFARGQDGHDARGLQEAEVEVGGRDGVDGREDLLVLVAPTRVMQHAVDAGGDLFAGRIVAQALLLQLGDELHAAALQHLGDAVEDLAAVEVGLGAPAVLCLAGHHDRLAEVFAGALADVGEQVALGVLELGVAARLGTRELAADVHLVGLEHAETGCGAVGLSVAVAFDFGGGGFFCGGIFGLSHGCSI